MDIETILLEMLEGGGGSKIAIAVGTAEGTRTLDGGFTADYAGHVDPGNKARNLGSFSYQHEASSPENADLLQIEKMRTVLLPPFLDVAKRSGWKEKQCRLLFAVACDVFVQSESACLDRQGFLDQIWRYREFIPDPQWLIQWRCASYIDPNSGKLNAPPFGNNMDRLKTDQARRTHAILRAIA